MASAGHRLLALVFLHLLSHELCQSDRSFTIDYNNNCFLKDGEPFRYISGGIHYFRVPQMYWKDRLLKIKAAGLNAIQTYVAWNVHEPQPGVYNFQGDADLVKFLQIADSVGLVVVLRAGPYICAEWDMGGFPSWLLKQDSAIKLRSSADKRYLDAVDSWMGVLLPKMKPLLYKNGGPIISVQVENEYGSYFEPYACDQVYLRHLQTVFEKHLGKDDVILFTVDGYLDRELRCGSIPTLFSTVDFGYGTDPSVAFRNLRKYQAKGPLVNSEYYTGWLDHWGEARQTRDPSTISSHLDKILALNASVNMYMFEGGTNFAFMNGANMESAYKPVPTSYDYDAPLTEAGDTTVKYNLIRKVALKYLPDPGIPVPQNTTKRSYGVVNMKLLGSISDEHILSLLHPGKAALPVFPPSMEEMDQDYGFILYRHKLLQQNLAGKTVKLVINKLCDRAVIMVDGARLPGALSRHLKTNSVSFTYPSMPGYLDILVENQGRVNFGAINDPKGIVGNVTLNDEVLRGWETYTLPLNNTEVLLKHPADQLKQRGPNSGFVPSFYTGSFPSLSEDESADSFLSLPGWVKGQLFINDFNLGRYWPTEGPQQTLFVPASVLRNDQKPNTILLFELDGAPCDSSGECQVKFLSAPVWKTKGKSNIED